MKTTTKRETVAVNVVRYEQGDDWARFEMREHVETVLFSNSRGVRLDVSRDHALQQMAALEDGRWERSMSSATLPAWAA